MDESLEQTQRQMLKRRLDDAIYYSETAERFVKYFEEADDLLMDCLKHIPEDVVVAYMQELASATFNRARADNAYQLLKSAYVTVNPGSIVGEM